MTRNLPILRTEVTQVFCGICPDPGHCCRRFHLNQSFWTDQGLEDAQRIMSQSGSPFKIEAWGGKPEKDGDREFDTVICSCPKVTAEGRCSIYETRPRTCRKFAAGSDPLCVFASMSGISFNKYD